jgi:MoaA/NifB/PqqE/SkfB family radical SAM enzyme
MNSERERERRHSDGKTLGIVAKIVREIFRPFKRLKEKCCHPIKRFRSGLSREEFRYAKNYTAWRKYLHDERLYSSRFAEEKKAIFAKYVKFIEIEAFSFCNRQCWFCPNAYIDRHSQNILMPAELYSKIIDELAAIRYSGMIWYSRYNEPFSDRIILERFREAREKLPDATLHTYTNGDYLTKEYLDEAADAGLSEVRIMRYPSGREDYDENRQRNVLTAFAEKIGLPYKMQKDAVMNIFHPTMTITVIGTDPDMWVCNRSHSVAVSSEPYKRTCPCYAPFTNMYIDHNGSVMPCCNMRSDVPLHAEFIMGNAAEKTLYEMFTGVRYSLLRYQLRSFGEKVYPCSVCDNHIYTFSGPVPEK